MPHPKGSKHKPTGVVARRRVGMEREYTALQDACHIHPNEGVAEVEYLEIKGDGLIWQGP